jgi:hypothetical protein
MRISATVLLDPNADRSLFEVRPGDEYKPGDLSIADVKEMTLAINANAYRIHELVKDFNQIENRVIKLEERLETAERRVGVLEMIVALSEE